MTVMPISSSWKYGTDVRRDLRNYISRRGVVGLRRIRGFLYARYNLDFHETEFLLQKMVRLGELRWHFWARYSAPRRRKDRRDGNA